MLEYLIDITDFSKDKLIPQITDSERVNRAIKEAQEFDLCPLLGDAFYYDILNNYDPDSSASGSDPYDDLMNGCVYADTMNLTVKFPGLRMALKYWAYARYISSQQINVTSHSVVTKTNNFSEPTDLKVIGAEAQSARAGAVAYWEKVVKFLNTKLTTYPLWYGAQSKPRNGVRISSVGGDNNKPQYDPATKRIVY